jgi:hypothetical protein
MQLMHMLQMMMQLDAGPKWTRNRYAEDLGGRGGDRSDRKLNPAARVMI